MAAGRHLLVLGAGLGLAFALPVSARESLGVFGAWGTFRDAAGPTCYAIAAAEPSARTRDFAPYVTIGTWPAQNVRAQFHVRLSRRVGNAVPVMLRVGGASFALSGVGADAWTRGPQGDGAILAAMRAASQMVVSGRDLAGNPFADIYRLDGAATAMDAASVACAPARRR